MAIAFFVSIKIPYQNFAELVPDLVVEIKSQSDRINPLKKKINQLMNSESTFLWELVF